MNDPHSHARIDRLRDEISGIDRAILDAVNARLALVAELKRYKEEHGIPVLEGYGLSETSPVGVEAPT